MSLDWSRYWKDADGKVYLIEEDMSESYIKRCINAIKRNGKGNLLGGPEDTLSAAWMAEHREESLKALQAALDAKTD